MPLYDGRECPDCGAVCLGSKAVDRHERHHVDQLNWQESLLQAIERIARAAGLRPRRDTGGDDETAGDSLVTKARQAARNPEYDEDDDEEIAG
jgi:prophage tail gpP-like protein